MVGHDNDFLLPFALDIRRLNGVVPALFTFALIKFAGRIDLAYNFLVDCNPILGIDELVLKHGDIQHFVLNRWVWGKLPLQCSETAASQLGFSLNCSSQA